MRRKMGVKTRKMALIDTQNKIKINIVQEAQNNRANSLTTRKLEHTLVFAHPDVMIEDMNVAGSYFRL
jgi:hypothetical protein